MANTGGAGNPGGSHLMVCLAANRPENKAIIVPIVSLRNNSDTSCVLNMGDHPFIRHPSCADYAFIRAIPLAKIDDDVARGDVVLQAPVSRKLLVRLQVGLIKSDEVEQWAYDAAHADKLKVWLRHRGHIE